MATIDASWGYEEHHDTLTLKEWKEREKRLDEEGHPTKVEVHQKDYGIRA